MTIETVYRPELYLEYKGTKNDCRAWIRNGENYVWTATRDNTADGTYTRAIQLANASMTQNVAKALLMVDIVDSAYKYYNIFGEHNKPSGSFTGNGSAERRTIDTGGIGWAVAISSEQGNSLVFRNGAFAFTSGGATYYPAATLQMKDGIIFMNSADSYFNKTGTTYYYQVL